MIQVKRSENPGRRMNIMTNTINIITIDNIIKKRIEIKAIEIMVITIPMKKITIKIMNEEQITNMFKRITNRLMITLNLNKNINFQNT